MNVVLNADYFDAYIWYCVHSSDNNFYRISHDKGKDAVVLQMELRQGAHLPFPGHWDHSFIDAHTDTAIEAVHFKLISQGAVASRAKHQRLFKLSLTQKVAECSYLVDRFP